MNDHLNRMRQAYAPAWHLGLDLGQRHDHAALATIELAWICQGRSPVTWESIYHPELTVRDLQQYQLGTGYRTYAARVQARAKEIRERHANPYAPAPSIHITVDAGGPGAPVVEEIRAANPDVAVHPVTITGGRSAGYGAGGFTNVPRRSLISTLMLLIEHQTLAMPPQMRNKEILYGELMQLKADTSHPASGHDDLAIALALAAWQAVHRNPVLIPRPEPGPKTIFGTRRLL
jgi:hypothetical protein